MCKIFTYSSGLENLTKVSGCGKSPIGCRRSQEAAKAKQQTSLASPYRLIVLFRPCARGLHRRGPSAQFVLDHRYKDAPVQPGWNAGANHQGMGDAITM